MSTPNINCILQAVLAAQNNLLTPPPQIATYDFANPTLGATAMFFEPFFQVGVAPIVPNLPATTIFALLVQNQSPTANVTLSYTPTGGVSQSIVLGPGTVSAPGDVFAYFCPSKNASAGITAVSLVAGVAATPVMIYMAG